MKKEKEQLLDLVRFFDKITIIETDVTTNEERANGQLVLIVSYQFEDKVFNTKKLYYRDVVNLNGISHKTEIIKYFGTPIYWLDIEKHKWPKPSGESDLDLLVIPDIAEKEDTAFISFLKLLANNAKTGNIQQITGDGSSNQYHHNLENNNHWHDLVSLIKAFIKSRGKGIDKSYFSKLVFRWDGNKNKVRERATLTNHAYRCDRAIVRKLQENLLSIQNELNTLQSTNQNLKRYKDMLNILKYKHQVILQGPPGTGKTRLAKEIAYQAIFENGIRQVENERKEDLKKLEKSEQYKLIQFHPAYSYEDFVRGITAHTNDKSQIEYKVENRILAEFAQKAIDNPNGKYVLIIDEINRANLPAVLGELIYALEYRNEAVQSIYALKESVEMEGNKELILPPNLYLIGTMNTADRSVGHIDYAIRRRFAFVEVLPTKEPIKAFAFPLFKKVSELFIKDFDTINWDMPKPERSEYLAADFRPENVWLGHSYFLTKEEDKGGKEELSMKLQYEILPILTEYINDGILNESARSIINSLNS